MTRQSGVAHQAAPDRQHLLLAARQGAGALVAAFRQPREQRIDPLQGPAVPPDVALGNHQVLGNAQGRENPPPLRHQAHAAADRGK